MHHGDGNLTILHLSAEDRGTYECVASNAVSDVITTSLLVMESKCAIVAIAVNILAIIFFPIIFLYFCGVFFLSFLHDSRKECMTYLLHICHCINIILMTGSSVVRVNIYKYYAENAWWHFVVGLATNPHAPYNVTVSTTQFTAKVSWLPAYDGGHPQHYVLWYAPIHIHIPTTFNPKHQALSTNIKQKKVKFNHIVYTGSVFERVEFSCDLIRSTITSVFHILLQKLGARNFCTVQDWVCIGAV